MARFLTYTFPPGNTQDVCLIQNIAGAANLVLNGNLVDKTTNTLNFLKYGYSRQVSLTSANNLSARQFTITGIQNGVILNETIGGPNNNTVYSTNVFDTITAISVNGAVNGISIGTGWQGFFPLIDINLEKDVINYTLTLATDGNNNSIAIFGTIDNIVNNGDTYLNMVANNYNLFTVKTLGVVNQFAYYNYPGTSASLNPIYSSFVIQLGTAAAAAINVPIKLNFIQT